MDLYFQTALLPEATAEKLLAGVYFNSIDRK
jgi:hypothetical protein